AWRPAVWATGLDTSYGVTAVIAAVALLFGFAALRARQPLMKFLALAALIGVGLALAASGHASTDGVRFASRTFVFLHVCLVALLLALGAANRYRLVPHFERLGRLAARPLVASIAIELTVAVVIFGLVASWRFTPPPRALAASEAIAFHIHDPKAMINAALAP